MKILYAEWKATNLGHPIVDGDFYFFFHENYTNTDTSLYNLLFLLLLYSTCFGSILRYYAFFQ